MLRIITRKLLNNKNYFSTSIVNYKPCETNFMKDTDNYYKNIEVENRIKEKKKHEQKMELISAY